MLTVKNIHKSFGGVKALDGCSFEIQENKITALIGPNGAGKTTLFDIISGLLPANFGEIYLEGRNIANWRPDEIANLGIARTFQQVRLFKNLTILDHLLMAKDNQDVKLLANLINGNHIDKKKYKAYIASFGIEKKLDTKVSDLSYGQRKLLNMAIAFLKMHKILLLDEPVAGVNKVLQKQIEKLLLKFKEEKKTILIIEHDMEFVKKLADWVIVLDQGKVIAEGAPNQVLKLPHVLEAYLGE
jgi:ABC-type branched-subunit amino acid transport system ATPase component